MLRPTSLLRFAAAVALTVAAGVVLPVPAATATTCSGADGVTVVVDFHELGGGLQQVCDAGSGQSAAARFVDAGFDLDRVQRQPGFVCRVDGAPADDPCVNTPPADAYWSLWWSNGTSGEWTFASQGVDSLKVPDGGSVALSWKGSSESSPPGSAPPAQPASPSPSPSASAQPSPSSGGGGSPTSPSSSGQPAPGGSSAPGSSGSASASTSSEPSSGASNKKEQKKGDAKRVRRARRPAPGSATPSADASSDLAAQPAAAPDPTSPGGLPVWVAPVGIGALFAAAAATAVVRRRRGPGPA